MSINEEDKVISSTGFWTWEENHGFDKTLCQEIGKFFLRNKCESLVDLGCGCRGHYVNYLRGVGIKTDGYDGNPTTSKLTNNNCGVLDLSIPHKFDKPYDWVMSIEVGEHLPKKFEDIYMENLHNNNVTGILMSWARKGQGGRGHFNEQNNDYIKSKMIALGYENDLKEEQILRNSASLPWFRNTIMVFRKKNK